jgi:hypothetical protein
MSVSTSLPATAGQEWFQPGTHSLWAYDREGRGKPALVVVYEWEEAGLRGVYIEGAWGDLRDLSGPKTEWDSDYTMLDRETIEQEELNPLEFARLVAGGHMHRIGAMPLVVGFDQPPIGFGAQSAS